MSAYVLTPLAKADIFNIWVYIAENSESAAERVERAIYDACAFLAEGPLRGHTRPDLTPRPLCNGRAYALLLMITDCGALESS